jgi:HAD superfamily hydrolase (TIGR01509 family)
MPVLFFDVMSTLVHDPIFTAAPRAFGVEGVEPLFGWLDPEAWVDFELGRIDEATYFQRWRRPGAPTVDPAAFRAEMAADYAWLPGIESLLADLKAAGHPMHTLSNYPVWWRRIEARLGLARYLDWTVVSCEVGLRKPDAAIYGAAAARAGCAPEDCIFVDDRAINVQAAERAGMRGIVFDGDAARLRAALEGLEVRFG